MREANAVVVTLSEALWAELLRQAITLNVSVEWLVAGLVCDTFEHHERS